MNTEHFDRNIDVVGMGACYVDTNLHEFPFDDDGILPESEIVGGDYEVTLGGSAVNFCVMLQELGLTTAFVGLAGTDPNGDQLAKLLQESGIQPAIARRDNVTTNIGFNMTSPTGKHIMLVGGTASKNLESSVVMPKLDEIMPRASMLYLGGFFKLKSLIPAYADIIDQAKQHGADVILDHGRIPANTPESTLAMLRDIVLKTTCYFPSRGEFCQLWSVPTIEDGLQLLHEQAPDLIAVVKDGSNGAFYFTDGQVQHVEAQKVDKVLNLTGAGDSFNAGVIAGMARGHTLLQAVQFGCQVAAAKIQAKPIPSL